MILPGNSRQGYGAWLSSIASQHWFPLLVLCGVQACANVGQMLWSYECHSISLKTNGYHTGLMTLLTVSRMLTEALRAKPADDMYSYGYGRFPVLLQFTGITVLSILSLSATVEAILSLNSHSSVLIDASLGDPMHIHKSEHAKTRAFAIASVVCAAAQAGLALAANAALRSERLLQPTSAAPLISQQRCSFFSLADFGLDVEVHVTVVAYGVMVTCALASAGTGWWVLDEAAAILSVALLLPILNDVASHTLPILLQTAPAGPRAAFDKASREVSTFEGALDVRDEHFWVNASGVTVGSITVRVRGGVDAQEMLARVRKRFAGAVSELTVEIEVVQDAGKPLGKRTTAPASEEESGGGMRGRTPNKGVLNQSLQQAKGSSPASPKPASPKPRPGEKSEESKS